MSDAGHQPPAAGQILTGRPVAMFSAPGHRDTIWSDVRGSVTQSREINWSGGIAAAHRIEKVTGAATIQTQTIELQFSWNSGYVEADAESGKQIQAYKNRPRYGLILPPGTPVEFRIKEKSNYRFLSIEFEPAYVLRMAELQHLRCLDVIETWDYNHPLTWQLAQAIHEECESDSRQGLLYCETAIMLLVLHVVRHLSNYSHALKSFRRGGLAPNSPEL